MKIVLVYSHAYHGHTLLTYLLGNQKDITAIGNGSLIYMGREEGYFCSKCSHKFFELSNCKMYEKWNGENFYRFNFDHYKCKVLVDSFASVDVFSKKPYEEASYFHVFLSKAPHEWAHSYINHRKWEQHKFPDKMTNKKYVIGITALFDAWKQHHDQIKKLHNPTVITYQELAKNPEQTIKTLCNLVDMPFTGLNGWCESDTHHIGGNPAIVRIEHDKTNFLQYLFKKYTGKCEIKYDSLWQKDEEFLEECEQEYNKRENDEKFNKLLVTLGHSRP